MVEPSGTFQSLLRRRRARHRLGRSSRLARLSRSLPIAVTLGILLTSSSVVASAAPAVNSDLDTAYILEQRQAYGLKTDDATMAEFSLPGVDVATAEWGFPMTAAELSALDLNGRIRFADEVSESVMPLVRALPEFAGAYVDQLGDGSIVIMLTRSDPATVNDILARSPQGTRSLRVVQAKHSETELIQALEALRSTWAALEPAVPVLTAGLETRRNGLVVGVSRPNVSLAHGIAERTAAKLGVPLFVQIAEPAADTVCTDRDHCYTPLRAGVVIRNNTPNSGGTCTMGFHITIGTDEQFLTAGHCGCAYTAEDWHHMGLGFIGNEAGTMTNLATKKDIMKVQMSDVQASALMYADSGDMGDGALPILNETVFASLGISNLKKSGTVTSTWTNWTSNFCGATMWGGDTNISTTSGDSGSPIYRRFSFGGEWYITPIGVGSRSTGEFGRVRDALDHWGATVVNP